MPLIRWPTLFVGTLLILACGGLGDRLSAAPPVVALTAQPLAMPNANLVNPFVLSPELIAKQGGWSALSFDVLAVHTNPPRIVAATAASDEAGLEEVVIVNPISGEVHKLGVATGTPIATDEAAFVVLRDPVRVFRIADGSPVTFDVRMDGKVWTGAWDVAPEEGLSALWLTATAADGVRTGRWDSTSTSTQVDLDIRLPSMPMGAGRDPNGDFIFVASEDGCEQARLRGTTTECIDDRLPKGIGGFADSSFAGNGRWAVATPEGCRLVDLDKGTSIALTDAGCTDVHASSGGIVAARTPTGTRWWNGTSLYSLPSLDLVPQFDAPTPAMALGKGQDGRSLWLVHDGPALYSSKSVYGNNWAAGVPLVTYGIAGKYLTRIDLVAHTETPLTEAACASGHWDTETITLANGPWAIVQCPGVSS